jgi:hypothetical protein
MKIIQSILISFLLVSIHPNSAFSKCYEINMDTVYLTGTITIDTVSKNKKTTETDNCFMLTLHKSICIISEEGNKNDSIKVIQIMVIENKIKNALKYINKKVILKGKLYRSIDHKNKSPILVELFKITIPK